MTIAQAVVRNVAAHMFAVTPSWVKQFSNGKVNSIEKTALNVIQANNRLLHFVKNTRVFY
jgi:uncharacterized damage-inducible protein DinB